MRPCAIVLASAASIPSADAFSLASHPPKRVRHFYSLHAKADKSFDATLPTVPPPTQPFHPPPNLRGVFAGSGFDGLSDPRTVDAILDLTTKSSKRPRDVSILYLGTATYDLPKFRTRQTQRFVERGCQVRSLDVVAIDDGPSILPSASEIEEAIRSADAVVVGGGNTLYAVDRWTKLGVVPHLRDAMDRGAVLAGGSAGAICWFDGGHSDSMDPDSYGDVMLEKFGAGGGGAGAVEDEIAKPPPPESEAKDWSYVRVSGLGFLPGLMCPHHDVIQSNGVLRANDFDEMLLRRHEGELGIGIDHFAALVVDGTKFRVISLEGREGSVLRMDDGTATFCPMRDGIPGVWIKEVREGRVHAKLCPDEGKVKDLLKIPFVVVEDHEAVDACRKANPS